MRQVRGYCAGSCCVLVAVTDRHKECNFFHSDSFTGGTLKSSRNGHLEFTSVSLVGSHTSQTNKVYRQDDAFHISYMHKELAQETLLLLHREPCARVIDQMCPSSKVSGEKDKAFFHFFISAFLHSVLSITPCTTRHSPEPALQFSVPMQASPLPHPPVLAFSRTPSTSRQVF